MCPSISSNRSLQRGAKHRGVGGENESEDWVHRKGGEGEEAEVKEESEQSIWGVGSETSTAKDVAKDGGTAESKMIEEREKIERQRARSCYQSEDEASSRS